MKLLDKSPGAFILAAFAVLYGVVLTETWMLTTASIAAMTLVMALIIVIAGLLSRGMMALMGSEEYSLGEPEPQAKPAPQARPARAPRAIPTH